MKTTQPTLSLVISLSLIGALTGCADMYVENDGNEFNKENASAAEDMDDSTEVVEDQQAVAEAAAAAAATRTQMMMLTDPPSSADDATLSPRAAAARHGTHYAKTFEQLVQRWRQHYAAGMRMVDLDVFQASDGSQEYFATFAPGTGASALYRYTSEASFLARVETERQNNSKLVDMEIITVGTTTWYYGVWVGAGNNANPVTKSATWADFQTLFASRAAQGQRLADIEISLENDQPRYWGVWEVGTSPSQHLLRSTSLTDFGDDYTAARSLGQRLRHLSGAHRSTGTQEYVGVTEDAAGSEWAYFVYTSWNSFKTQWASQAEAGRSLRDLEVITRPAGGRYYVGTWGTAPMDPRGRTDTAAMAAQIEASLLGNVVGFSYAIADQSQLAIAGAGGLAQRAPDPEHPMTSKTPSTMASATKHFTGVATLALLEQTSHAATTPILGYLPEAWNPLASVNTLTFQHLLTHTSGFGQMVGSIPGAGNGWDGLQIILEQGGATPGAPRLYKNANFALQRVLIPALYREQKGASVPVATETNHGQIYIDALEDVAFDALGIEDVSCSPPAGQIEALAYEVAQTTAPGASWAAPIGNCGGHAWLQLNAQQMASFLTGIRYSDHLLSASSKAYMDNNLAGWSGASSVDGGTAYSHGGDFYASIGETHTCVIRLPNGIDASLIVNSDTTSPCSVLRAAFNVATP